MATIKVNIPVKVYERETMTVNGERLSKEIQVVAIPQKPKLDKKTTEQVVRNMMWQMYGPRKYKQKFDLKVTV